MQFVQLKKYYHSSSTNKISIDVQKLNFNNSQIALTKYI